MDRTAWRQEVAEVIAAQGVIDCHTRLVGKAERRKNAPGLFDFIRSAYVYADLLAAGLPVKAFECEPSSDQQRWVLLREYLPEVRRTSYYQATMRGFNELFNVQGDLDDGNWQEIDRRLREASEDDDWFEEVLGRRIGLRYGILDCHVGGTNNYPLMSRRNIDWHDYILRVRPTLQNSQIEPFTIQRKIDTRFFLPSLKVDALFSGYLPQCQTELEQLFGVPMGQIGSLSEYLRFVDQVFAQMMTNRAVAIESVLGAQRLLAYPPTARPLAEAVFRRPVADLPVNDVVHFENFLMHYVAEKAAEHGLPIQMHTGTPFKYDKPDGHARPDLLLELIIAHPDTRFDLMYCGYPYHAQLGNLAKRFSNVFMTVAWTPLVSAVQTRHILAGWLDMVPANKIFWGGDTVYVEEGYGSFLIARDVVADALGDLLEADLLDVPDALELARRIFYKNAMAFFPFEQRLSAAARAPLAGLGAAPGRSPRTAERREASPACGPTFGGPPGRRAPRSGTQPSLPAARPRPPHAGSRPALRDRSGAQPPALLPTVAERPRHCRNQCRADPGRVGRAFPPPGRAPVGGARGPGPAPLPRGLLGAEKDAPQPGGPPPLAPGAR